MDEKVDLFIINFLKVYIFLLYGSEECRSNPVDDLDKAETKAKESYKGGNKVNRTHPDTPLQLCKDCLVSSVLSHLFLTHDSLLAKKDVYKSNFLIPCVVELVLDGKPW